MDVNIDQLHNDFLFIPLGGAGEIGMNVNLYHYKGKWIMVDLGVGFVGDLMPGVDLMVADITFIARRRKDLLGIIVTHAHEDHCGAIQYLWDELRCPVYTNRFTAAFLKAKLTESKMGNEVTIHEIEPGQPLELDPFTLHFIDLTHSVPEMNAVIIDIGHLKLLHTGDWKFDSDPVVGPVSDYESLKRFGDEGVLAMVCDSTNVFQPGTAGTEGSLIDALSSIVSECKNLVLVTLFASNIARIESVVRAARSHGRKVAVFGRSLWRVINAAKDSGYFEDVEFLSEKEISDIPHEQLLLLCTGCQGESLAAVSRMVDGNHNYIELSSNDAVIFSSRIIPGNEKKIFKLLNKLARMDVKIFTEKTHKVHVSGHPHRDDLRRMYELVRPDVVIPVHGEDMHIKEHAELAKQCGVKHTIRVSNGDLIRISPDVTECIGRVRSGFFGIDGNILQLPDGEVINTRRLMSSGGLIVIILVVNDKGDLLKPPSIYAPGALDRRHDRSLLESMKRLIQDALLSGKKPRLYDRDKVVVNTIKRFCRKEFGKEPLVHVQTERIESRRS